VDVVSSISIEFQPGPDADTIPRRLEHHCQICTVPLEDGLKESPKHVRQKYRIFWPIRHIMIFSLETKRKKKVYECVLNLVIYWKKTVLLHTKIINHNTVYSS
jgi:hypothetical protein